MSLTLSTEQRAQIKDKIQSSWRPMASRNSDEVWVVLNEETVEIDEADHLLETASDSELIDWLRYSGFDLDWFYDCLDELGLSDLG